MNTRNKSFDTIRGITILFVIIFHLITNEYVYKILGNNNKIFSYLVHLPISFGLLYYMTSKFNEDYVFIKILMVFLILVLCSYSSFKYIESSHFKKR